MRASNLDEFGLVESRRQMFAGAMSVYPTLDPTKLIQGQQAEFGQNFAFLRDPDSAIPPSRETKQSVSICFVVNYDLFRAHLQRNLRNRSSFRDCMVVPQLLHAFVI